MTTREKHVAFTHKRYVYTDDDGTHHYTDPRDIYCGDQYRGEMVYCDPCEEQYERWYPQGWRYYPGDTCEHGKYTGGCGIDLMCMACELGE